MGTFLGGNLQTIGGRIFLVRIHNGLTQGVFAQYLGVSRQEATDYEHGCGVPPQVLVTLCQVFDVEWSWLTLGIGPPYLPSAFSFAQ
jgi:transcriptional regulator with XRE-family HTH domain